MNYSIIVPFYNESLNIKNLHDELTELINKSLNGQRKFELIYVDDGSTDDTFLKLEKISTISFDFNF